MDIRQQSSTSTTSVTSTTSTTSVQSTPASTQQEQQNITSISIFNLTKRKSLYNEMTSQYLNMAMIAMKGNSYIAMYSYKPIAYLTLACLYHLRIKKVGIIWMFMHAGAIMAINGYDLNVGAKKTFPDKWAQYDEATKNYELTLGLLNAPLWNFIKKYTYGNLGINDYKKILENRPH